jgi:hypothetical protein
LLLIQKIAKADQNNQWGETCSK